MKWSFYRLSDGRLTGRSLVTTDDRSLQANMPHGCGAVEGYFDHLSQIVDLSTGEVVDYQPPAPDDDHEWNAEAKRWRKRAEVQSWESARDRARDRIDELERQQARPIRELARDSTDGRARRRLDEIEEEIEAQRAIVNAPKPTRS